MIYKYLKYVLLLLFVFVNKVKVNAQNYSLDTVVITSNISRQPLLSIPSSAIAINYKQIQEKEFNGFLPVLNSISGVRMEERSPGSYRLAIRGSALRSPFGVRNVKIYLDDFPLTDAGGNTYLNLMPVNAIQHIEILKGPDGSLFGANSAGVVILNSISPIQEKKINFQGGSFGTIKQNANYQEAIKNLNFKIFQDYSQSEGYRNHSALKRVFLQNTNQFNYSKSSFFKLSTFYSDLWYETPGGLNNLQYNLNPKQSRPSTATLPSAEEQKASIRNKTGFLGIAHQTKIATHLTHHINVSGLLSNFSNPFITNFETRNENTFSLRSYFNLHIKISNHKNLESFVGYEFQNTNAKIKNFKNLAGEKGDFEAGDIINTQQQFIFSKFLLPLNDRIKTEFGLSVNFYNYNFKNMLSSNSISGKQIKNYQPELMPRFAISYLVDPNLAIRTTVSRGFSTPSVSEIRASDATINTMLNPEKGTNYEIGLRVNSSNRDFYVDISAYSYQLKNAIIKQNKGSDEDFFKNAGAHIQRGLEAQLSYDIISTHSGFVRSCLYQAGFTLSKFKFLNYEYKNENFSGKMLPGVPENNFSNQFIFSFKNNISISTNYQYASQIPLNDSNTAFAASYHLLQCKINWMKYAGKHYHLTFFAGADNILNEKYSLGNDINAFGGRFYNAAASRNYNAGIALEIK